MTNPEDDQEFEEFYERGETVSDIGIRKIRDVFDRKDAREVFDRMKERERQKNKSHR